MCSKQFHHTSPWYPVPMAKTKSTAVEKQKKPKPQPKAKKVASAKAKTPTQKKNKTTENNPFDQSPDVDQRSIQSFCIKPGKETIPMSAQSSEPASSTSGKTGDVNKFEHQQKDQEMCCATDAVEPQDQGDHTKTGEADQCEHQQKDQEMCCATEAVEPQDQGDHTKTGDADQCEHQQKVPTDQNMDETPMKNFGHFCRLENESKIKLSDLVTASSEQAQVDPLNWKQTLSEFIENLEEDNYLDLLDQAKGHSLQERYVEFLTSKGDVDSEYQFMSEEGDQHEDFLDFTAWLAERTGDSGDVT